jgi:hypothetical protein
MLNACLYFDKYIVCMWNKAGLISQGTCLEDGLYHADSDESPSRADSFRERIVNSLPPAPPDKTKSSDLDYCLHSEVKSSSVSEDECPKFANSFLLEDLQLIHLKSNHRAFSVLRQIYGFPPATTSSPDPICSACCRAEMPRPPLASEALSAPTRPFQLLTYDMSSKHPPDKYRNQRSVIIICKFSDEWIPVYMKRKSDVYDKLEGVIKRINNRIMPYKISYVRTDGGKELTSGRMYSIMDKYGIELTFSPSNTQSKNYAENGERRHQKACRATAFHCNAPPSMWSLISSHVCFTHNIEPKPHTLMSPWEKSRGIKPSFKIDAIFGCRVEARNYVNGALEGVSTPSIFLGYDPRCRCSITSSITGTKKSQVQRYCYVTKSDIEDFPWTHPNVPRPNELKSTHYESDTESEGDDPLLELQSEGKDISDNLMGPPDPMLRKGPDFDFNADEADEDIDYDLAQNFDVDARKNENQHDDGLSITVRRSARAKVPSLEAIESIKLNITELLNTPNIISGSSENPFKYLFDPAKDELWKDPTTWETMQNHPQKEFYLEAMWKERCAWVRRQVVKIVPVSTLPEGCVILNTKHVWKTKQLPNKFIDKFKYRLCVDGSVVKSSLEFTYEPCVSITSFRMLIDFILRFNLQFEATDFVEFYINSELRKGEKYFMKIPKGWEEDKYYDGSFMYEILRAVYGLPTASQTAGQELKSFLLNIGFKASIHDPNVMSRWTILEKLVNFIMVIIHSDDLAWGYSSLAEFEAILELLKKKYDFTRRKNPVVYRGIQIRYDTDGSITLHMAGYLEDLEKEYSLKHCKSYRQPGRTNVVKLEESLSDKDKIAPDSSKHKYMVTQGQILWAVNCYPSCAFMVGFCSRFMRNPQDRHFAMQKQTMAYMNTIRDKGINFRRIGTEPEELIENYAMDDLNGGSDSTWADCHYSSKATTGYRWSTSIGLLDFYSGKQCNVCNSSCESEIMSSRSCCKQGITIRGIYQDIGFIFTKPTAVNQDNSGAIALCTSDAHHKRSRHFRVASHFLKELYERQIMRFTWCSSKNMQEDVLTKPLDESTHLRHENALTGYLK